MRHRRQRHVGAPSASRASAISPGRAVVALSSILTLATLIGLVLAGGRPELGSGQFWAVVLLVVAGELMVFHFELRAQTHTIAFSEVALVVGLFHLSIGSLVAAKVIGSAVALALRRQAPSRALFNLSHFALEAMVAGLIFGALTGPAPQIDALAIGATYAATITQSQLSVFVVALVISLAEGRRPEAVPRTVLAATVTTIVVTSLGLLTVAAVSAVQMAAISVGLLVVGLFIVSRAMATMSRTNNHLELLRRFTATVGRNLELRALLAEVLHQASTLLNARRAAILVLHPLGPLAAGWWSIELDGDGPVLVHEGRGPDPDGLLDIEGPMLLAGSPLAREVGSDDGLVAPIAHEDRLVAFLVLVDHQGRTRGMDANDVRTFTAFVHHTKATLGNSLLLVRLREQALTDGLTGLPNRAAFEQDTIAELEAARTHGVGIGILMVDLDRFKEINDTLGHEVGDLVLQEVARRMTDAIGGRTTIYRFGGDEFAVLIRSCSDLQLAVATAHDLAATLLAPIVIDELRFDVGASIGVARSPEHGTTAGHLIQHADVAMHEAKADGLGRVNAYRPDSDANNPRRLHLANDLRSVIDERSMELHYQPKVALDTGEVVGVEALLRWNHPVYGPVSPDEFVAMAEHTGAIAALTEMVVDVAIAQASKWRAEGRELAVAINVSTRNLHDLELPSRVAERLTAYGLPSSLLHVEITETGLLQDRDRALTVMHGLRGLGVTLALDDFGTGYSSLTYLRELPVRDLKIDRSFVMDLCRTDADDIIVSSMVSLGHNLGLAVVAEGIEDSATWSRLREIGCDLGQGFHIGRPMNVTALEDWLERWAALTTDQRVHDGETWSRSGS